MLYAEVHCRKGLLSKNIGSAMFMTVKEWYLPPIVAIFLAGWLLAIAG